jgi:hypothetical protein
MEMVQVGDILSHGFGARINSISNMQNPGSDGGILKLEANGKIADIFDDRDS